MSETGVGGAGPLSALARNQYAALAAMRWQMFKNNLRTNQGVLELGARTVSYVVYGIVGLAMSGGLAIGAYVMVSKDKLGYLPLLFWAVFLIWQALPILLASFQEQFDLGILLRFPLGFSSYFLLYLVFGLVDVSTISGGLCSLGLWVGIVAARRDLWLIATVGLLVFAAFNVLLVRAIFAWIDRWLAQRRTREIVGAIFLLAILSLQFLNPALRQTRHSSQMSRVDRMADQQRMFNEFKPWLLRANAVQRWLPAGLAAQSVRLSGAGQSEMAANSVALLAMYGLIAGVVLAVRLNSEYAGESLGEAPGRSVARRKRVAPAAGAPALSRSIGGGGAQASQASVGGSSSGTSGAIAAVMEKELRAMLRTLPLLYSIGAPLILVLVFSGVFIHNGPLGHSFPLALPICLVYAQLGFTQVFYNNLGAEGMGIQIYFLAPTPIRTVLLAKNLFHSVLFAIVAVTAGVLAALRLGLPDPVILAASAAWLLFALPCNLAVGNVFSLVMAYRVNPGRLTKQRGSQANNLLSVLVQLGAVAIGALVFMPCWIFNEMWLAVPIFLALAVIACLCLRWQLGTADAMANKHKEELISKLAKAA
jgi:ABC-2 type transport system permease protein